MIRSLDFNIHVMIICYLSNVQTSSILFVRWICDSLALSTPATAAGSRTGGGDGFETMLRELKDLQAICPDFDGNELRPEGDGSAEVPTSQPAGSGNELSGTESGNTTYAGNSSSRDGLDGPRRIPWTAPGPASSPLAMPTSSNISAGRRLCCLAVGADERREQVWCREQQLHLRHQKHKLCVSFLLNFPYAPVHHV
jgi:hypothetical protein